MSPEEFIAKWKAAELTERAAAQSHFNDLCALLGEETPSDADPKGEWYAFEKGATKTTGGEGWADVWRRGCFGWEYKGKRKDLKAAFVQLQRYAIALENPPLLVVSDLDRFEIHTNWTNTVSTVYEIALEELRDPRKLHWLKWTFDDPEKLKPGLTRQNLTEQAAAEFATLAQRLRSRGYASQTVAHFINRIVFCMFAEDVDLLPDKMFGRMLEHSARSPGEFEQLASDLFAAMRAGGRIGFERVDWFNGGLFDDDTALPLTKDDITVVREAAGRDWAEIDPSIFGTLFERGLDPDKRSQLGAHYTDRDKIMLIVEPVITRPWLAEWAKTKADIEALLRRADIAGTLDRAGRRGHGAQRTRSLNEANTLYRAFLDRLRAFRVLDPACGPGNFLYLALLTLKDLEHRVAVEAEALGLAREFPRIGPEAVKGIEINLYAAELARVTVWIGEIQWMRRNGFDVGREPILKPLDTIECRDAVLDADGSEAEWPQADVVIGNPPYLGDRWLQKELGKEYVKKLRAAYRGSLPASANLVCYWFEKAAAALHVGRTKRVGLVATSTIRNPNTRFILKRMSQVGTLFEAWSNIVWVEGHGKGADNAAVRVCVTCYHRLDDLITEPLKLDGVRVARINPDLSARGFDLTTARALQENKGTAFQGIIPWGKGFVIPGTRAREFLCQPVNVNGCPNSDVLFQYRNASDLTKRSKDRWLIDMNERSKAIAALYEKPFHHLETTAKIQRAETGNDDAITCWWQLWNSRPAFKKAIRGLQRYIATPRVAEHRFFVWLPSTVLPDSRLVAIARDDDTFLGVLESYIHKVWTLAKVALHGVGDDPTYNTKEIFETFPFPEGFTPNRSAAEYADDPRAVDIAEAARRLNELREAWLNPPDLVKREREVVPGFPDRILPVDPRAAAILRTRTLTNLYNERPAWLDNAHRDLDAAVAAAYGWTADISEDDALARLLALNLERASQDRM